MRVFDFVWVGDFAAARNAATARATSDYVFWLDADDVVDPPEREKLRALLDALPRVPTPFGVRWPGTALSGDECVRNLRRDENANAPRQASLENHHFGAAIGGSQSGAGPPHSISGCTAAYVVRCSSDPSPNGDEGQTVVDHIRLFPLREDVRWSYRVHVQGVSPISKLIQDPAWFCGSGKCGCFRDAYGHAAKREEIWMWSERFHGTLNANWFVPFTKARGRGRRSVATPVPLLPTCIRRSISRVPNLPRPRPNPGHSIPMTTKCGFSRCAKSPGPTDRSSRRIRAAPDR